MDGTLGRYVGELVRRLRAAFVAGTGSERGTTNPAGSGESGSPGRDEKPEVAFADYDPSSLSRRRDFVTEVGVRPDEFLLLLIEERGGSLPQKAFTEFTDLSDSTVSRLLQEMEDDGRIVRVRVGRENIVYLPERAPSDEARSTGTPDDPPRA